MTTRQQNQRLSEIASKPTFRIIDGVSLRFVESDPGNLDALLQFEVHNVRRSQSRSPPAPGLCSGDCCLGPARRDRFCKRTACQNHGCAAADQAGDAHLVWLVEAD